MSAREYEITAEHVEGGFCAGCDRDVRRVWRIRISDVAIFRLCMKCRTRLKDALKP